MNWTFLRSRVALGVGVAGIAALGFAGGVAWTHNAGTAAAAMDLQAQHGFLGLGLAPITDAVAKRFNTTVQDGLMVVNVTPGGPGAKAGIQQGDIVKSLNGTAIPDFKSAQPVLQNVKSGDTVQVGISRAGQNQTIAVTAGDPPARPQRPNGPGGAMPGGAPGFGGGFGMMPHIPELQGIAPGEMFDHFQGGSFKFKDKNGADLTVNVAAGKVTSASDTALTISANGGGSSSFSITPNTKLRGKGSDLKTDTKVVVITKNGSNEAVSIMTMPNIGAMGGGRMQGMMGSDWQFMMPDGAMPGLPMPEGAMPGLQMPGMGSQTFEREFRMHHEAQPAS